MSSCPTVATLESFLLGRVEEEQQEQIEQHLKICPHCVQQLDELHAEDALTQTVRSNHGTHVNQQEQDTIAALIDHLQQQYTALPWERKRFSPSVRKKSFQRWTLAALAILVGLVSASLLLYALFLLF